MKNFQLKNPQKIYIWKVISTKNLPLILHTRNLTPKDFWFQVGQFVRCEIKEMQLIGYKYIKDHYGNDVEEVYQTTGKFMKKEVIEEYNKKVR